MPIRKIASMWGESQRKRGWISFQQKQASKQATGQPANIFDYYVIKVIHHKSLHLSRKRVHANCI